MGILTIDFGTHETKLNYIASRDVPDQKIELYNVKNQDEEVAQWVLYAARMSDKYGVSFSQVAKTIDCESGWLNIQSEIVKKGVQEPSFGLSQIHLPSHKHISKKQALDPYFAIKFMTEEMSAGNDWKWYGYSKKRDACTWGIASP